MQSHGPSQAAGGGVRAAGRGLCKLGVSSSTPTPGVLLSPASSPLEPPVGDVGLCSSCCPGVLLHRSSLGQGHSCVTAARLAILLHSVLLQVLQVTLNPGVSGIGTDLAASLCDEPVQQGGDIRSLLRPAPLESLDLSFGALQEVLPCALS